MGISRPLSPAGTASWSPLGSGAVTLPSARLTGTGDSPSDDIRVDFCSCIHLRELMFSIWK